MKTFRKLSGALFAVAIISAPFLLVANLQGLEDWWKLRDYTAPASISQLAHNDTMTDSARRLFYINHPKLIDSKKEFRSACPQGEQTIVLGCYHPIQSGIAIYDVTDKRLSGVEEVTAAHEMLHAAYDRLGKNEKNEINNLLSDYYKNKLHDDRVIKTIKAYEKSEPNDVVNEMHSVFGTEVKNLPKALEDHYKQYFTKRQQVVNFSEKYQSIFVQNQQQLSSLKSQIENLKSELRSDEQAIKQEQDSLAAENKRMQALLASNKTKQYNEAVTPYNNRVKNLQSMIDSYNSTVEQVNSLVRQYNSTAYNQESLFDSLDSRPSQQTAQ